MEYRSGRKREQREPVPNSGLSASTAGHEDRAAEKLHREEPERGADSPSRPACQIEPETDQRREEDDERERAGVVLGLLVQRLAVGRRVRRDPERRELDAGEADLLAFARGDRAERQHERQCRTRESGCGDPSRHARRVAQRTQGIAQDSGDALPATLRLVRAVPASEMYAPTGDQPRAIEEIAASVSAGNRFQTLLGATGTGKTATMAWIIEKIQRPALVIAHNKTLAAQLCNEFREFFPENAVEYFVSYYDYYQPEAYVPQADLYIEKDSSQNDDIARLRLSATSSLLTRRDAVVVASVSCIYGLGSPEEWRERVLILEVGQEHDRDAMLRKLIESQYVRNDTVLGRGRFRVKGDVVEVQPANIETAYRISFFGDEVEQITHFNPLTGEVYSRLDNLVIWPATEYVTSRPTVERAIDEIKAELEQQVAFFEAEGRMLEAHRIRQRTEYDMEMLKELGFTSGIENYSQDPRGPPAGLAPVHAHRLLPGRLRLLRRRVAPDRAAARRHVRGRPLPQADARRLRLPAPLGARQPPAPLRRVPREGEPARLRLGDSERVRAHALEGDLRAAHPSDRGGGSGGRAPPDAQPDRRPPERDPQARGGGGAHARHDADEEDGRGPDRLPARGGRPRALPALRDRHARADRDHPRASPRRVRRARRRQPPARGARPAGGVPGGRARRRQGGLPAREDRPRADDRAGSAQREREGAPVRRQADGGDRRRARGDEPAPRVPDRVQRGARDHTGDDRQGRLRHRGAARPRVAARSSLAPPPRQGRGRGDVPRGAREARHHARGGDVPRRRGAPLRVRREAPGRDQGPAPRADRLAEA